MVPIAEEICALCGEAYRYYQLQRCYKCNRLYCRNCTALDEENKTICLNCFRRIVSPRNFTSRYAQLSLYLARRAKYAEYATLSFKRIEEIIGDHLPYSAYHYNHWWNNTRRRSPSEAWMTTGWIVQKVNLENQEVTFQKKESSQARTETQSSNIRRRKKRLPESFKALARKHLQKKKVPSKTKVAKVQAMSKNLQRKAALPRYPAKLKPKKAYEKRLYKSREKPEA